MLEGGCRGIPGADYRQPSSTDEGTCRDAVHAGRSWWIGTEESFLRGDGRRS